MMTQEINYKEFYCSHLDNLNSKLSTANELRFGTKGALSVNLKDGAWFDHQQGQGGGVFSFLTEYQGITKIEAKTILYGENNKIKTFGKQPKKVFKQNASIEKKPIVVELTEEEQKKEEKSFNRFVVIHHESKALEESQELQRYLLSRLICLNYVFELESLREFNSSLAMGLNQDYDGLLVGYQLKKFDKKSDYRIATYFNKNYQKGSSFFTILNWQPQPQSIGICEGVETGLSIIQLKQRNIAMICCLTAGNMSKFTLNLKILRELKEITVYGDNDQAGKEALQYCHNYLLKAKKIFKLNLVVNFEYPPQEFNDFNDILLNKKMNLSPSKT